MQLGIVDLGRMGGNIARRLLADGHRYVVHDLNLTAVDALTAQRSAGAESMIDPVRQLAPPGFVGFGGLVELGPQA